MPQDLFVSGAGPMVEIFNDRIEIANPGVTKAREIIISKMSDTALSNH